VQPAGDQPVRLLAFHLLDGTATVRVYDPADRRVERGILVPRRFGKLVERARRIRREQDTVELARAMHRSPRSPY
jgi:hypothetical protein